MKINKKIIYLSLIITTITLVGLFYGYTNFNNQTKIPETFAVFIEQPDGSFLPSNDDAWPADYLYDSAQSYCKMGSTLEWDYATNSVNVAAGGKDECYIYFKLPPDIFLARMTFDNSPITAYPAEADNLAIDVNCTNARGKWNYETWKFQMDNITGPASCSVDFTTVTNPPTLANHIISLNGETVGNGTVVTTPNLSGQNTEYRYNGINPNNYIYYNNSLWRIIGVFEDDTHGVSGQNLVKIINEESFTYVFDAANDNSWAENSTSTSGATLNLLYNTYFYNATDGTSHAGCRTYSTTITTTCDFRENGLSVESRNMVQSVTWELGGYSSNAITPSAAYTAERGTTTSSGTVTSATANIGLMHPSDYGYAAPSSCWSTNIGSYSTASCGGNNWLLNNDFEWTITPNSSSSGSGWRVGYSGNVNSYNVYFGSSSRPVLYLKSGVEYVSGTGSKADPFVVRY